MLPAWLPYHSLHENHILTPTYIQIGFRMDRTVGNVFIICDRHKVVCAIDTKLLWGSVK